MARNVKITFADPATAPQEAPPADETAQDEGEQPPAAGAAGPVDTFEIAPGQLNAAAPGVVVAVDATNFEREVLQSPLPVIVETGGPWCLPCEDMKPILADLARQYQGRVKFCRLTINVTDNRGKRVFVDDASLQLAQALGVGLVPDTRFFVQGGERSAQVGYLDQAALVGLIHSVLGVY